jgi:predicted ATPase/class 3 adenylate cyclase
VDLPTGTVSFLFTDVEGSTRLLDKLGAGYDALLEAHRDILRSSVEEHAGAVFGVEGDAVAAVFASAGDGVAAAGDAQRRLTAYAWPEGGLVRVRMAVHTGDARQAGDGYFGMALHVTARVCSAGHGGQVLLTGATQALVPGYEVRDLGGHRLKDLNDAVQIGQLLGDGLAESFPPLRTLTAMPNNLPASTDDFIGRTVELAKVIDGLASHRLVTLTGAGGSGKTRLALEAAGSLLGSLRDGAWVVELAALSDASRVPALVASVLGLGERAGRPVESTVAEWLRSHDVLLFLDNCEHVVEGVAEFVDRLLRSCPALRILATSRELLGVRGELALRVPPLGLDGEAAELFLARARDVVPGFDREAVDLELVGQVCRRLDGLPLAIELAVARLRSLSLAELATRLDDRFRLLTGGSRTDPSRQRTLEAVVAWSYDLLPESERELFRALSVFADSFTLDAVAAVTGSDVLDVIDGLGRLVEKSLVLPVEARSGIDRYQLLETLRQYARDRLVDLEQADSRRDGLLAWALGHVERLERDMRKPAMDAALAAAMPEHTNLRAAMEWASERGDLTSALRLASVVPLGLTTERRALIVDLLARGGDRHPSTAVAQAQLTLANLASEQGDWTAAIVAASAAQAGFEQIGDRFNAAWSTLEIFYASWGAGDLASIDRLLDICLREFRALDDAYGLAQAVWCVSLREPDRARATAMAVEGERRFRELGSPIMVAHVLEGRALIELNAGDVNAAAPFLREAVAVLAAASNLGCTSHTLEAVAVWAAARGDASAAGELVGAAETLREVSGAGHKPWEVRARHHDYDASVLGDTDGTRQAVARGRLHSLSSAAALADALLAASFDGPTEPDGDVEGVPDSQQSADVTSGTSNSRSA